MSTKGLTIPVTKPAISLLSLVTSWVIRWSASSVAPFARCTACSKTGGQSKHKLKHTLWSHVEKSPFEWCVTYSWWIISWRENGFKKKKKQTWFPLFILVCDHLLTLPTKTCSISSCHWNLYHSLTYPREFLFQLLPMNFNLFTAWTKCIMTLWPIRLFKNNRCKRCWSGASLDKNHNFENKGWKDVKSDDASILVPE